MIELKYPSQRLAYPFFVTVLVLFLLQITYGLTIALQQVDPYFLQGVLNFNINRAAHVNLAIIWILTGIVGTLFFVGPLVTVRDLAHAWTARVLLVALWGIVLWTALTLPLAQWGIAGWAWGQPWLQEGLEYLEAGRVSDVLLLIAFAAIAYVFLRLFPKLRQWNEIHWALAIGLLGLTTLWIFGMFFVRTIDLGEFFRWFVVHYWVEGIWEILHVALVGMLLYTLFGADLAVIRFAVFWGVVFVALSGLLGNGHHYFWIGTPSFWQFWGALFSALEPLPILLAMWHVFTSTRLNRPPIANKPAFYFTFGSVLLQMVGAGILGFSQTFPLTNVWEHGTWVTPAHAHLALFGTFGFLVLGGAYAAVPAIKGLRQFNDRPGRAAFWILLVGILGMMISFALGGTVQVYVYRVLGLDWFGAEVRPAMELYRALLIVFGSVLATGVVVLAYDLLTMKQRAETVGTIPALRGSPQATWWRQPLSPFEMGGWLAGLWFFGLMATAALFAYNLSYVRMGDPTLPYLLAGIAYPAIVVLTIAFALRFLRAVAGQQGAPDIREHAPA